MRSDRRLISAAIEILIDVLDRMDGDIDLEDDDREPEPLEITESDVPFLDLPSAKPGGRHA